MKPKGTGYLAGPMTGKPNYNYELFGTVTQMIRGRGLSIHNPAEHFGGDTSLPRREYIQRAILAIMVADWVCVLPGWDESYGANLELDIAVELGLPVYEYNPRTGWLEPVNISRREPRTVKESVRTE